MLNTTKGEKSSFMSTNVDLLGTASMIPRKRIITTDDMKVGVTAVFGKQWQQEINNADITFTDPKTELTTVAAEMKNRVDLMVLLSYATRQETIDLAKQFPQFRVVVTADTPPDPPAKPPKLAELPGRIFVETGHKGMYAIVLGFFDDAKTPLRSQRVPLDSRFAQSPEVLLLRKSYQNQLKMLWQSGLEKLGIRPVPYPEQQVMGSFVGSDKCKDCHDKSYTVWRHSKHAQAWATLKKAVPPRDFDPECVSCHAVGWHPTDHYPYTGGFESEAQTPHLVNVGCESCHGPGQKHVAAEMGADAKLQKRLQEAVRVTKEEAEKRLCYSCHDGENSPGFDFKKYWPDIEHHDE
jgi:hypothetical protein